MTRSLSATGFAVRLGAAIVLMLVILMSFRSAHAAVTKALVTKSHTVVLSWGDADPSATFNLYRGSTSGTEASTPYVSGISGTSYTDAQVVAGGSYFYFVTAVNAQGDESKPSNEASAILAAPPSAPFGLTAVQH